MAENSAISWTDHTFNPWIGCTKVSPACDHCYAARQDAFRKWTPEGWGGPRRRTSDALWRQPVKWNAAHDAFLAAHGRRQRVFCASLADVFDNQVPPEWRAELFALIAATPNLDWLLLTKRIGNVATMIEQPGMQKCGLPENVWLGATVVTQEEADRDVPKLLELPARVRFLSIEPMLGPINLTSLPAKSKIYSGKHHLGDNIECRRHMDALRGVIGWVGGVMPHEAPDEEGLPRLHWVIAGGESGPGARAVSPHWPRWLQKQCADAGVAFHWKQWGEWLPVDQRAAAGLPEVDVTALTSANEMARVLRVGVSRAGRLLDGVEHNDFPKDFA